MKSCFPQLKLNLLTNFIPLFLAKEDKAIKKCDIRMLLYFCISSLEYIILMFRTISDFYYSLDVDVTSGFVDVFGEFSNSLFEDFDDLSNSFKIFVAKEEEKVEKGLVNEWKVRRYYISKKFHRYLLK